MRAKRLRRFWGSLFPTVHIIQIRSGWVGGCFARLGPFLMVREESGVRRIGAAVC